MVELDFCLLRPGGLEKDELEIITHQEPVPKKARFASVTDNDLDEIDRNHIPLIRSKYTTDQQMPRSDKQQQF